eukprot:TRINITY_DN12276_c1_g3_i1.p1 TRINITY_DN12276_c1_g3~~TRINITY_DN12276_c1_g3_i1.p1  ORF type:complete len:388 (-),score=25.63 TRINITY_DN12276_c1_g3_i1:275-1438(-)
MRNLLLIVILKVVQQVQSTASIFDDAQQQKNKAQIQLVFKGEIVNDNSDTKNQSDQQDSGEQYLQMLRNVDKMARMSNIKSENIQQLNDRRQNQYVGLCTIARDEHLFIREWIMYHKYIGVSKFYVYDHMSIPPMESLLQDFIKSELVEYTYVKLEWLNDEYNLDARPVQYMGSTHTNSPQRWAHVDCFKKHGNEHQFMAMIDIDEFIVLNQGKDNNYLPVPNPDLPLFLEKYNETGGLFMQWRIFGSNGHVTRPEGLVLKNYLKCETQPRKARPYDPKTIKHMVNMKFFLDMCIIHSCFTSVPSVNSYFEAFRPNQNIKGYWQGLQLNHYLYKSLQDFDNKRNRGGGHMNANLYKQRRTLYNFHFVDTQTKGNCTQMEQLAQKCCS